MQKYNKIWIHKYDLSENPRWPEDKRQGLLLKLETEDWGVGYGCCHPWPQLGDACVEDQISYLKTSRRTKILDKAIDCAMLDAEARSQERSLIDPTWSVENHCLVSDLWVLMEERLLLAKDKGFQKIKIKVGRDLIEEAKVLNQCAQVDGLKWRLDFNGNGALELLPLLSDKALSHIEWLEDPIPYDEKNLAELA